jgi:thioredoxin reductase (NADPH)
MSDGTYDLIIVGGGPAGLTAGLYAARGRMNVLLLESLSVMGQAAMTEKIENYPGIDSVSGFELMDRMKKQAAGFGLECGTGNVESVVQEKGEGHSLFNISGDGFEYRALSVILAAGASPRKLDIPGESELTGSGVSYCATCDAAFFRDKRIVVIGGGNSAVEEALFLTRFGRKVTIVHRRDRLRASGIVRERAFASEKMDFVWDSVPVRVNGDGRVESLTLKNIKTGETSDLGCDGVFVFIGWEPNTDFVRDLVDLGRGGAISTGPSLSTSRKGVFAAGDCREKKLHQVVTACGDGAVAAYSAQQYVDELKGVAYK